MVKDMKNNDLKVSIIGLALGILLILAVLGVENIFSKKETLTREIVVENKEEKSKDDFIEKVKKVYNAATSKYLSDKLSGNNGEKYYSSSNNDLNIKEINYYIRINSNGSVVQMILNDDKYKLIIGTITSNEEINVEQIGKTYEVEELKNKLSSLIGDINKDGKLSYEDIETYRNSINKSEYNDLIDINGDNQVDESDINELTNILIKGNLVADLNKDGKVNKKDLEVLQNYVSNPENIEEENKVIADVNNDGKIDTNDTKQIEKSVKTNKKVKYIIKHWKQKITDDIRDESHYALVETQELTANALTSVTPKVKSYTGFTSPNAQKITILSDGSTVLNYYYKRNQYKYTLYTDVNFEKFEYTREYNNISKEISKPSNINYPYKLLDINLYYDEIVNLNITSNSNDIIWTSGSDVIKNGKSYSFRVKTSNITNKIMTKPITYEILENADMECTDGKSTSVSSFGGKSGKTTTVKNYTECYAGEKYLVTFGMGQQSSGGNYIKINSVNITSGNVNMDVLFHYVGACNATTALTNPRKQILFSRKPDNLDINISKEYCNVKNYNN